MIVVLRRLIARRTLTLLSPTDYCPQGNLPALNSLARRLIDFAIRHGQTFLLTLHRLNVTDRVKHTKAASNGL